MNNNIKWKQKYAIYPFEFPDGVNGFARVHQRDGVQVFIIENEKPSLIFKEKNFQKTIIKLTDEYLPGHEKK